MGSAGGGYFVGWTEPGEYLEYTVDVSTAGTTVPDIYIIYYITYIYIYIYIYYIIAG